MHGNGYKELVRRCSLLQYRMHGNVYKELERRCSLLRYHMHGNGWVQRVGKKM